MYVSPSGSVVYSTWHMFGSFVLLRALDAVVATAAAEESDEALTVPFEAVVALEVVPTAAVGAAAVAAVPVARPESSDSSGFSAEKSSARRPVSIKQRQPGQWVHTSLPPNERSCRRKSSQQQAQVYTEKH